MTFYPQCRITYKGNHRLHDRLNNFLIANAAITIAANYLVKGEAKFAAGAIATYMCNRANLEVRLPIFGPFEAALANKFPDRIHIDFYQRISPAFTEWAAGLGRSEPLVFGLVATISNMISPIFVEYYEAYRQFIHTQFRTPEKYPPLWRFARVVRNSIAHGGFVSIQNAKESPVEWCGLKYSHRDNGRTVIGIAHADLNAGDLLVLMFEMSDLLDEIGCTS